MRLEEVTSSPLKIQKSISRICLTLLIRTPLWLFFISVAISNSARLIERNVLNKQFRNALMRKLENLDV